MKQSMGKIFKYSNVLNKISFDCFTELEQNVIFVLIFLVKGKYELELKYLELEKLLSRKIYGRRIKSILLSIQKKLFILKENNIYIFDSFFIDEENGIIRIIIGEKTAYLYNDLRNNYTILDLEEFMSLGSVYAKTLYRLLKQWDSVREKSFKIEDFRNLLSIPIKYRISEINKIVIDKVERELPKYFPSLRIRKIKKYGRVVSINFSWEVKKEVKLSIGKNKVVLVSQELSNAIEKSKRNRFIQPLLTPYNIGILMKKFEDENDLIKGLNFARKGINKEIFSLNYLTKTIKTSINYGQTVLVVKNSEKIEKSEEDKRNFENYKVEIEGENKEELDSEALRFRKEVLKISTNIWLYDTRNQGIDRGDLFKELGSLKTFEELEAFNEKLEKFPKLFDVFPKLEIAK